MNICQKKMIVSTKIIVDKFGSTNLLVYICSTKLFVMQQMIDLIVFKL